MSRPGCAGSGGIDGGVRAGAKRMCGRAAVIAEDLDPRVVVTGAVRELLSADMRSH